jgi:hypothetical protein
MNTEQADRDQAEALLLGVCILVAYHAIRSCDKKATPRVVVSQAIHEGQLLSDVLKSELAAVVPK